MITAVIFMINDDFSRLLLLSSSYPRVYVRRWVDALPTSSNGRLLSLRGIMSIHHVILTQTHFRERELGGCRVFTGTGTQAAVIGHACLLRKLESSDVIRLKIPVADSTRCCKVSCLICVCTLSNLHSFGSWMYFRFVLSSFHTKRKRLDMLPLWQENTDS